MIYKSYIVIAASLVLSSTGLAQDEAQKDTQPTPAFEVSSPYHKIYSEKDEIFVNGVGEEDIFKGSISGNSPGETVMKVVVQKLAQMAMADAAKAGVKVPSQTINKVESWIPPQTLTDPTRAYDELMGVWEKSFDLNFYTCEIRKTDYMGALKSFDPSVKNIVGDFWEKVEEVQAERQREEDDEEKCISHFATGICTMDIVRTEDEELQSEVYTFTLSPEKCESPYLTKAVSIKAMPQVRVFD